MALFPQVPQQDASPEIAKIYADIRAVSGLPVVNLIWRHFATLPDVLPWAWAAVAPLIGSTAMGAARNRMADAITLPPIPPRDRDTWRAAGVTDADLREIAAVNDAYIRGNLTNIISLTALRLRLDYPDRAPAQRLTAEAPPRIEPLLDPLPPIDALEAGLATRIQYLAALHEDADERVIPSLYLALARWPGVIGVLPDWLSPLYHPQILRSVRKENCRLAEIEAQTMLPPRRPLPEAIAELQSGLRQFTNQVIPDLIAVGFALRRLLPVA